jgi:hypothetical protein
MRWVSQNTSRAFASREIHFIILQYLALSAHRAGTGAS